MHQHQAGHIRDRGKQQESDGGQQRPQAKANGPDEVVDKRRHIRCDLFGAAIFRRKFTNHTIEICARKADAESSFSRPRICSTDASRFSTKSGRPGPRMSANCETSGAHASAPAG